MSAPIPLRQDFAASQLGGLPRRSKDGSGSPTSGTWWICDGATCTEAAKIGGVGLQIIRDWGFCGSMRAAVTRRWTASRRANRPSSMTPRGQAIARMIDDGRSERSIAWCAGG